MAAIDFEALKTPFPSKDVEWRIQQSGLKNGKPWAMVLAYIDNRAIQNRLDDVCGPANWRNEYLPSPNGGVLCGISILTENGWVTKWDGADNTDIEAVKGGLSDSMKRAAVQWGIGRYLYNLEATFAVITDNGKYRGMAEDKDTHKKEYFKWDPPALPAWALPAAEALSVSLNPSGKSKQTLLKELYALVSKAHISDEEMKKRIQAMGKKSSTELTPGEISLLLKDLQQDIEMGVIGNVG